MKLIEFRNDEVSLSMSVSEFNFLREALRELPQAVSREKLPTLTGFTHEQVKKMKTQLRGIAEEINVDL
ncbi:hypothetical protein [Aliidiomarina soli]|uniref:Uncharacterized protein n=1 Tax=Aliidiomarina soli TaxID=1928574 RepID=A0A432WE41_9GAMM|nr:hypothetical protein [Aliidiomarina soli]RUO31151.1 hypothetical protein CWE14_11695 [Aliidiomarina soli]